MSQTAYPISFVSADWTGVSASLGDGSDATYVTSPLVPDDSQSFVCDLAPLADPGIHTAHQIRLRAKIDTPQGESLLLLLRLENRGDGSIVAMQQYSAVSDSFAEIVLALTEAEAGRIQDYAMLRLRGYWYDGNTTFVWDAVSNATTYVLQVGTTPGASDRYNADVGPYLAHTLGLATGTYYNRFLAYQGATLLSTSDEQTVTV